MSIALAVKLDNAEEEDETMETAEPVCAVHEVKEREEKEREEGDRLDGALMYKAPPAVVAEQEMKWREERDAL